MSDTRTEESAVSASNSRLGPLSDGVVLVAGVLVVPLAIAVIFGGSDTAPDAAAYVRMAFTEVVGSTVAIMTVLGVLLSRAVQRRPARSITSMALVAVLIAWWQISAIIATGTTLVQRLALLG